MGAECISVHESAAIEVKELQLSLEPIPRDRHDTARARLHIVAIDLLESPRSSH